MAWLKQRNGSPHEVQTQRALYRRRLALWCLAVATGASPCFAGAPRTKTPSGIERGTRLPQKCLSATTTQKLLLVSGEETRVRSEVVQSQAEVIEDPLAEPLTTPEVPAAPLQADGANKQPPPAPPGQFRPITDIQPFHDYDPDGDPCDHLCPKDENCPDGEECPEETPFYASTAPSRMFAETHYMWMASDVYHHPLYFQDVPLERYGHVHHSEVVQPFYSLARFGMQLGGIPYQMLKDPPHSCRYALGFYRPGDCAPQLHYATPFNDEAGVSTSHPPLFEE